MRGLLHESVPALDGQSLRVLVWERELVDMWCLDRAGGRQPYRGKGSLWHHHPEIELTLITRGAGILSVGDHIGGFTAPDCVLFGGDVPHAWTCRETMAGVSLQFRVDPASGLAALPEFAQLERLWSRARHGLRWRGPTAERLGRQLLGMEGQPALERLARFLTVLGTMCDADDTEALSLSCQAIIAQSGDGRAGAMQRVLEHIMEHYQDDLRLETVVDLSDRSQATFCRHFAKATGKTFSEYVNAIRILEVKRALLESERSVTDIALGAGFNSLTNFYATFRRVAGCTPLAFRRGMREGRH